MIATTATDARSFVTATAETSATASKAHWGAGDQRVTITRRRLTSGLVRITIRVGRYAPHSLLPTPDRVEYRDLEPAEAERVFVAQLMRYDAWYVGMTAKWFDGQELKTWKVALAA